jgi:mannose-1-phosphate guanylyltransferase/phosphomannomutase
MILDILIVAGGKGTRSLNPKVPKSLQKVSQKKIIEIQLDEISRQAKSNIVVVGGFKGIDLKNFLEEKKHDYKNLSIQYVHDDLQIGTFNALKLGLKELNRNFSIVILGDLAFTCDLMNLYEFAISSNFDLIVASHPNLHPKDSDLLLTDMDSKIVKLLPKNRVSSATDGNLAAAGIFLVNKEWVFSISEEKGDMTKALIESGLEQKKPIFAWVTSDLIMDLGTSKNVERYEEFLKNGHAEKRRGRNKKAIFLDLDGTVFPNIEVKNIHNVPEISQSLIETIGKLNQIGVPIIVCTNQPGIAKGLFTKDDFLDFKRNIESQLSSRFAYIDAWYVCPHHPESGWPNEVAPLKISCFCRKPGIGMFEKARDQLGINLNKSIFFGDSEVDAKSAKSAGIFFTQIYSNSQESESTTLDLELKKAFFDNC